MSNFRMEYFDKEDILWLITSEGLEADSVELAPNITAELNDRGELIGIEILCASFVVRDLILNSLQAKRLGF